MFFFFKQKTAYEMRISDWSSDVGSSDLESAPLQRDAAPEDARPGRREAEAAVRTLIRWAGDHPSREGLADTPARVVRAYEEWFGGYALRSEEHTSELQSLMRISYAVFCLKKKIHHTQHISDNQHDRHNTN